MTALLGLFVALAVVSALVNGTTLFTGGLGLLMTIDAIAIYFVARMVPTDDRGRGLAVGAMVALAVGDRRLRDRPGRARPGPPRLLLARGAVRRGEPHQLDHRQPEHGRRGPRPRVPFALFGSRHLADPRLRWAARIALVVLFWALLLTFSRGAWFSVGIAAVVGTLLLDWRSFRC